MTVFILYSLLLCINAPCFAQGWHYEKAFMELVACEKAAETANLDTWAEYSKQSKPQKGEVQVFKQYKCRPAGVDPEKY
jgi:hypothetical protein